MYESMQGGGMWSMGPLMLLMMLVMAAVIIAPFWAIFSKAGYSKWLSLLMVVPPINLVLLYFLAFSKWPDSHGNSIT